MVSALLLPDRDLHAQAPPREITLYTTIEGWQDTGISLQRGETVRFDIAGVAGWEPGIEVGPEGGAGSNCAMIMPGAAVGAVMVRAGSATPAISAVGNTVTGPGRLEILYNDCPGKYFDNSGAFFLKVVTVVPVAAEPVATQAAVVQQVAVAPPVAQPATPEAADGPNILIKVLPVIAGVLGLVAAGAGAMWAMKFFRGRMETGPLVLFPETARLESSAWLAPIGLRDRQLERRSARRLTVGGPDHHIDFGMPAPHALLVPQEDGGVRIEKASETAQVFVDGMPLVLGQRLADGSRVKMGPREFVFRMRAEDSSGGHRRPETALSRIDPRLAALHERKEMYGMYVRDDGDPYEQATSPDGDEHAA